METALARCGDRGGAPRSALGRFNVFFFIWLITLGPCILTVLLQLRTLFSKFFEIINFIDRCLTESDKRRK